MRVCIAKPVPALCGEPTLDPSNINKSITEHPRAFYGYPGRAGVVTGPTSAFFLCQKFIV